MISQKFITTIIEQASAEIKRYGVPSPIHFKISLAKGRELARRLDARENLVGLGTALMDIKLGEALEAGKLSEHVHMSLDYAKALLESSRELTREDKSIVYDAIATHHTTTHASLESEIVTNADCYRFIHPMGVFEYMRIISNRNPSGKLLAMIAQVGAKLNEKWELITLPIVREELKPYYKDFTKLFTHATKEF